MVMRGFSFSLLLFFFFFCSPTNSVGLACHSRLLLLLLLTTKRTLPTVEFIIIIYINWNLLRNSPTCFLHYYKTIYIQRCNIIVTSVYIIAINR